MRQWQALTGSAGHPIQLTPEITLALVPADHLRIESLTFAVHSLDVARSFLNRRQLLDLGIDISTDTDIAITISWAGVQLRFTEPAPQRSQ